MEDNMPKKVEGMVTAKGVKVALVISRFNSFISERLKEGAVDCLLRHDGDGKNITEVYVPGAFEMPLVTQKLVQGKKFNAVICLGAVIRGSTPHFDYVASEMAKGIAQVTLKSNVPVSFGVLTTDTIEQAVERAGTKAGNKGWDAAMTAMEMVSLLKRI
jgi:6,7-dimethyl-8-ribityllumazine synthase